MDIFVDKNGNRVRINRPRIEREETYYSLGVYDPYQSPNFGLYEGPPRGRPDILAPKFSTYFKNR